MTRRVMQGGPSTREVRKMVCMESLKSAESEILDLCVRLETSKARFYHILLKEFPEPPLARTMWWSLWDEGCRRAAALDFISIQFEMEPHIFRMYSSGPATDLVCRHLRQVERYERRVRDGQVTLDDAFKMALRLKSDQLESLFDKILSQVDPVTAEMAMLFQRPIVFGWAEVIRTIQTCSLDEMLLRRIQKIRL